MYRLKLPRRQYSRSHPSARYAASTALSSNTRLATVFSAKHSSLFLPIFYSRFLHPKPNRLPRRSGGGFRVAFCDLKNWTFCHLSGLTCLCLVSIVSNLSNFLYAHCDQFFVLIRFTTILAIISFSDGLLSAIIRVMATSALLAILFDPSLR